MGDLVSASMTHRRCCEGGVEFLSSHAVDLQMLTERVAKLDNTAAASKRMPMGCDGLPLQSRAAPESNRARLLRCQARRSPRGPRLSSAAGGGTALLCSGLHQEHYTGSSASARRG